MYSRSVPGDGWKRRLGRAVCLFLAAVLVFTACSGEKAPGTTGDQPKPKPTATSARTATPAPGRTPSPPTPTSTPQRPRPLPVRAASFVAGFVDFSGVWRSVESTNPGRCDRAQQTTSRSAGCEANFARSLDWMDLTTVSTNVSQAAVTVELKGAYHHGHSFWADTKQRGIVDTGCRVEILAYPVTGKAIYSLNDGSISLDLRAVLPTEPSFKHATAITLSGYGEAFGIIGDLYRQITSPPERRVPARVPANGVYGFTFRHGEVQGPADSGGCNSSIDGSELNVNYVNVPVFTRAFVHEASPLEATASITGKVRSKSGVAISRGTIHLLDADREDQIARVTTLDKDGAFALAIIP